MCACELFEKLKENAKTLISQMGYIEFIKRSIYIAFDSLEKEEKYTRKEAYNTIIGLFASVACNDGEIKMNEHEVFHSLFKDCSYDEFFNYMSRFNKQDKRDATIELFKRMRITNNVISLVSMCIALALVDGDMNINEELFITSLCDVYLAQDRNGWYYQ